MKKMKKKILFICPSLFPGGTERALINILKNINREKYIPYLALFEKKGEFLNKVPGDVSIYDLKKRNKMDFIKMILLLAYKIYPVIKPHIVIGFTEYVNLAAIISRILSFYKPSIIISERTNIRMNQKYLRKKNIKIFLIRKLYPLAHKIIAVSKGVMDGIINAYNIAPDKIRVIYNGVDLHLIKNMAQEDVNIDLFKQKDINKIICCGRLSFVKNYSMLLKAFAKIEKKIKVCLFILGHGEERDLLERLIEKLGLREKVFLLGYKNNPFKYIAKSDVFILSSLFEGFPNVLIEAMACDVPVISTNCPYGPNEIISDGVNGLLTPVQDMDAIVKAILRLLINKELKKRLSEAGKKRSFDFRVQKMVKEYERLFDDV